MRQSIFLIVTLFYILPGCMTSPEQFTEKRIIVASKATVTIPEINLTVTNNGCGRKWVSDGDQPSYERAYCDLVFKRNEVAIHAGNDSKPIYIGDLQIDIEQMNPWGRTEDSIPPGGCRLLVKRIEGR